MTSRALKSLGLHIVTDLTGEELFPFEHGSQKYISAKDLRAYLGGDIAVPNIRAEAGAHARKISHFPNAGEAMTVGDVLTGLQNGDNVNFTRAQVLAPLVEAISRMIDERIVEALRELGYTEQAGKQNGRPGNP